MPIYGQDPHLHAGRVHIILIDQDGRNTYTHGIAVAPEGFTERQAQDAIREAYADTIESNPGEWNYDHVIDQLEVRGFDHIPAGVWVE